MPCLHLVPVNVRLFPELASQLQAALGPGDSLLLTGSGLYGAGFLPLPETVRCFALHADAAAGGFSPPPGVELIDYAGMVRLCEAHERSLSWA